MILRLYLKGLEGLKLSSDNVELVAEVSPIDNKRYLHIAQVDKQQRSSKSAKSEPWTTMDGRLKLYPLQQGYYEVRLPKELFAMNPESITMNWVDFLPLRQQMLISV